MTSKWRDQWETACRIPFVLAASDAPNSTSLQEAFTALGIARIVAGARAPYMHRGGWRSCFLAMAYGDAGELQHAISSIAPEPPEDAKNWRWYSEQYFCGVDSHFGIGAEHAETIVRCFDADQDMFMAQVEQWLHSHGASVATVLALAQADAEAQALPRPGAAPWPL